MLEGMVRLDLFCYEDKGGQGNAARSVTEQIVLPPAAFLRAYEAMGELVRRMEQGGLVRRKGEGGTPGAEAAIKPTALSPHSPNFE